MTCEKINGVNLIINDMGISGGCNANNQGVTTEAQKGKDAKVGDPCFPYVFEGRCDGNMAITCPEESKKVTAKDCPSGCKLDLVSPEYYVDATCFEDDIDE